MYNAKVLGQHICEQLEKCNMTQADLARYMNVARSTASGWCSGRVIPRMNKVAKMADLFGVPVSELVEDDDAVQMFDFGVTAVERDIIQAYRNMNETTQQMLHTYIEFILHKG